MSARARRTGEPVDEKTADQLAINDLGRIVQTPGNRGYLRGAWRDDDSLIAVCTTAGIAHYPPSQPFLVWGDAAERAA